MWGKRLYSHENFNLCPQTKIHYENYINHTNFFTIAPKCVLKDVDVH